MVAILFLKEQLSSSSKLTSKRTNISIIVVKMVKVILVKMNFGLGHLLTII